MEAKAETAAPQAETQVETEIETTQAPGFAGGWDSSRPTRELNPANILRLQRTIGNQAVQRMIAQHKANKPAPAPKAASFQRVAVTAPSIQRATVAPVIQRLMSKTDFQKETSSIFGSNRGKNNPILFEIDNLLDKYGNFVSNGMGAPEDERRILEEIVARIENWKVDSLKNDKGEDGPGEEYGIEGKEVKSKRTAVINKLEDQIMRELKDIKIDKAYTGTKLGANNSSSLGTDFYEGENEGTGKFVDNRQAPDKNGKSDKFKTRYLSKKEKIRFRIYIDSGVFKDVIGNLLDSSNAKGLTPGAHGGLIFVMSKSGKLYAADMVAELKKRSNLGDKREIVGFHHSSFLSGGDVAGAGEIQVSGGQLQQVSDASGHYKPKPGFLRQVLQEFIKKGVVVGAGLKVFSGGGNISTPGDQFLINTQMPGAQQVPPQNNQGNNQDYIHSNEVDNDNFSSAYGVYDKDQNTSMVGSLAQQNQYGPQSVVQVEQQNGPQSAVQIPSISSEPEMPEEEEGGDEEQAQEEQSQEDPDYTLV